MLPSFPEFKPLDLADRVVVDAYTRRFPPYNDFGFTSLWSWDTTGSRKISDLAGNLIVQFTDYCTQEPFLSFLGDAEPERTALELIRLADNLGISPVLRLVPEESARAIRSPYLDIREDRDHFEYILSVPQVARFEGSAYKTKRQNASRFAREHPNAVAYFTKLGDKELLPQMREVIRRWEDAKKERGKGYDLEHEEHALERLFATADQHHLLVGGLFIDNVMHGFTIEELVPNGYCIGQFWKADLRLRGIYEWLAQKTASYLETLSVTHWNWEQDLGDELLRTSKLGYQPIGFLKKYSIAARSSGVFP